MSAQQERETYRELARINELIASLTSDQRSQADTAPDPGDAGDAALELETVGEDEAVLEQLRARRDRLQARLGDSSGPPMDAHTSEATQPQLDRAKAQGDAYGEALEYMTGTVAHDGGQQRSGDYLVGYAVEEAEGMYEWVDGELAWREPGEENLHLEVVVRDAGDGRFIPCLGVTATLLDPEGNEVGTHEQPMLWHPMIYHYGRNWTVPVDGPYTLRVRVEPPTFMRHDEVNGLRFTRPADVEFTDVQVQRGRD